MIDVPAAHDGYRLEAAVRMLRKSRHNVAMVHAPAVAAFEILPEVAPDEGRCRTQALIAFWVIVDMVNAEEKWILRLPPRLKRHDVNNRIIHSLTLSFARSPVS